MRLGNLDLIGYYGPMIQIVITSAQLFMQKYYLAGYITFLFINMFLNKWLKLHYKESRPSNEAETGAPFDISDPNIFGMPSADNYGMPSGHSQSILYSVSYLYFVTRSTLFLILGLMLSAITIYQRWQFKRHTVKQLAVGSAIGILMGYLGVYFTGRCLKIIYG